jgi:twitching motility protein PilT
MAEPTSAPAPAASGFNFKNTIGQMVQRNASDLLLKVGRPPTVRVNGDLVGLEMPPLKPEDLKMLAEQVMTPRQVKEFAEKKEADFAIGVPGVGRFRTNVYQQRGTLAFAFRAIPYEVKTITELHLPEVLEEIALRARGLVLVTGVTGSGKSTALAAMINHVNQNRRVNVITIEDPIEFLHRDVMSNISQREVGSASRRRTPATWCSPPCTPPTPPRPSTGSSPSIRPTSTKRFGCCSPPPCRAWCHSGWYPGRTVGAGFPRRRS